MATIGEARVTVVADTRAAEAKIQTSMTGASTKAGSSAGAAMGRKMAAGLGTALAGVAVAGALKDAVSGAMEFGDAIAASGVIFGKAQGQVQSWAEGAAQSMGLSKLAALDAANGLSAMGKAAGLQGSALAGFSTSMVQLGGDLASFRGGTAEEAVTAIGAAMRGETEPIRRYGVLLDDATLRARAMKMGLIETTTQALTPQQKALAAQAEILAQTTDAQGDFARTADGAKNETQTFLATLKDQSVELGQRLVPAWESFMAAAGPAAGVLLPALGVALGVVGAAFSGLVTVLGTIGSFISDNAVSVGLLTAALLVMAGPAIAQAAYWTALGVALLAYRVAVTVSTAAQWLLNAALTANPIGAVVVVLLALAAGLVYAYKHSETFRNIVAAAFSAVKAAAAAVVGWFQSVWRAVWPAMAAVARTFGTVIRGIWEAIKAVFRVALSLIRGYIQAWIAYLRGVWAVLTFLVDVARNVWDRVVSVFTGAVGRVRSAAESIVNAVRGVWEGLVSWFASLGSRVVDAFMGAISGIGSRIAGALPGPIRSAVGLSVEAAGMSAASAQSRGPVAASAAYGAVGKSIGAVSAQRRVALQVRKSGEDSPPIVQVFIAGEEVKRAVVEVLATDSWTRRAQVAVI